MKRRKLNINIDNHGNYFSSRLGTLDFYGSDPAELIANIGERYPAKSYKFNLRFRNLTDRQPGAVTMFQKP